MVFSLNKTNFVLLSVIVVIFLFGFFSLNQPVVKEDSPTGRVLLNFDNLFEPQENIALFSTCGNGSCEPGENSCVCQEDCGQCAGDVPGLLCRQYSCDSRDICTITIIPNCCGNELCESNENYGTCIADCTPTKLDVEILKPEAGLNFFKGEAVPVKVKLTAHDRSAAAGYVLASSEFQEDINMFNDGKHDDEKRFDPFFGGGLLIPSDVVAGNYNLKLTSGFFNLVEVNEIPFTVAPRLDSVVPLQDVYFLGDKIEGVAFVGKRNVGESIPLTIEISNNDNILYKLETTSDNNGNFSFSYKTSLIDPVGNWDFRILGVDDFNNQVDFHKELIIKEPSETSFLKIDFLSDFQETYIRGEELRLIVELSDELNNVISSANVYFIDPSSGQKVSLVETNAGQYSIIYVIPYDIPVGLNTFEIKAEKYDIRSFEGNDFFSINVEPSEFEVFVAEPDNLRYRVGEKMPLRVFLTYPSGRQVSAGDINAWILDSIVPMKAVEAGIYSSYYVFNEEEMGVVKISFLASDEYGNFGRAEKRIEVSGADFWYMVKKNSLTFSIIFLIILGGLLFGRHHIFNKLFVDSLKKRKKQIHELQKGLQLKYFNEGLITKSEYEGLMNSYQSELDSIEAKLNKYKKQNNSK